MDDLNKAALEKEQKQVNRVYAALVAMIVFSCVPLLVLQVLSILLLFYVVISAYALRSKYGEESLVHNHMTFLIRTFWISSLFFAVGMVAAVLWMMQKIDAGAVNDILNDLINAMMTGHLNISDNLRFLLIVSLITMGPSIIYFIYRAAKGLSRALKGHRMGNVKEWF